MVTIALETSPKTPTTQPPTVAGENDNESPSSARWHAKNASVHQTEPEKQYRDTPTEVHTEENLSAGKRPYESAR